MKNALLQTITGTKIPVWVVVIIGVVLVTTFLIIYLRGKTLNDVRKDCYELFLDAEHAIVESGSGPERLKWVVDIAYPLLPRWLQFIITEKMFKKIVSDWFKEIKDLLDDGKNNDSAVLLCADQLKEDC